MPENEGDAIMSIGKQVSVSSGRAVTVMASVASMFLPFKANADSLQSRLSTQAFYQTSKGEINEAGLGIDHSLTFKYATLGVGGAFAGDLGNGATSLEKAGTNLTLSAPSGFGATVYAQRSRFLGNQRAFGGLAHMPVGRVNLRAGAERDITGNTPVFAGADFGFDPVSVSVTAIVPIVPGKEYPNAGGTIQLTLKTKLVNFFARVFGMSDPEDKKLLAENAQIGIEVPIR